MRVPRLCHLLCVRHLSRIDVAVHELLQTFSELDTARREGEIH